MQRRLIGNGVLVSTALTLSLAGAAHAQTRLEIEQDQVTGLAEE